jgi:hypothetical protein
MYNSVRLREGERIMSLKSSEMRGKQAILVYVAQPMQYKMPCRKLRAFSVDKGRTVGKIRVRISTFILSVVRVSGYRSRGPAFDSRRYQIF